MKRFGVKKSVISIAGGMVVYCFVMEFYYYYFVGVSYERFLFELKISSTKLILFLTMINW